MKYKLKIFGNQISRNAILAISSFPHINILSMINADSINIEKSIYGNLKIEKFTDLEDPIDYLMICSENINILNKKNLSKVKYIIISNKFINLYPLLKEKFNDENIFLINYLKYDSFFENIFKDFINNKISRIMQISCPDIYKFNIFYFLKYLYNYEVKSDFKNSITISPINKKIIFKDNLSKNLIFYDEFNNNLKEFSITFDLIKKTYTNIFLDILEQ